MDWEAVGAISEGLGAVAVFLTLGYLSVQVRYGIPAWNSISFLDGYSARRFKS